VTDAADPAGQLKHRAPATDSIVMEDHTKILQAPLWVFGMLFLAYLSAHVSLLLLVYTFSPSTSFLAAEALAIAGGAVAARIAYVAWRRGKRP
jgi:hypothetical protein